ncbi:MAG: lytic transglycosylase domain-containing protein [Acetobacteraceae bacterium]|nr:lytic transglycosylase domain-containing protein [Acetobacteraceae bacterium]
MRGIRPTFARRPPRPVRRICAIFTGLAVLAGPPALAKAETAVTGNGDETAFARPRVAPINGSPVAFPQPLAPSQAARIRQIFALQSRGDMDQAAQETEALSDKLLLGAILADRFLGQHGNASLGALSDWLSEHADEPDAPVVFGLLLRRLPEGARPAGPAAITALALPDAVPEETEPADRPIKRNSLLDRTVATRAQAGNIRSALHLIAASRGVSPAYAALLRGEVARALFLQNRDEEAVDLARGVSRNTARSEQSGLASYIGGLAACRLGRFETARLFFEEASRAELAPATIRSAGAFWAARVRIRLADPAGYAPWMRRAAAEPRTFYGLLARRALGLGSGLEWQSATLGEADIEAIDDLPAGRRAFALLQVDQPELAAAELRSLWPEAIKNPGLGRALLLVASHAGFTDLAAQLAGVEQSADGRPRDFARFPVPRLAPRGGFQVDPALVYGLTRVESNFEPSAVSRMGARGLMQLMPVTAGYIANDRALTGSQRAQLHDPAINLELGQRYLQYLARLETVNGDLIGLLASYNAGPGSYAKWRQEIRDDHDPLLFIEAIPNGQTRAFVQRVLTYTWIYAMRLDLPAPSRDDLAAARWPRFTPAGQAGDLPISAHSR